jgi:hypothetical protein
MWSTRRTPLTCCRSLTNFCNIKIIFEIEEFKTYSLDRSLTVKYNVFCIWKLYFYLEKTKTKPKKHYYKGTLYELFVQVQET